MSWRSASVLLFVCALLPICGCDATNRHKVLTSVIDGWPTLPAQNDFCREYENNRIAGKQAVVAPAGQKVPEAEGSRHAPYIEKRCPDCHASAEGVSSNLIKPKNELCFLCHQDLLKKSHGHGPAVDGNCLACHEPHESVNKALLVKPRNEICNKCHEEKRLAVMMHRRVSQVGVACPDCHNPHSENSKYLLK
jgi:predicted CXXCH cytochrome family protein